MTAGIQLLACDCCDALDLTQRFWLVTAGMCCAMRTLRSVRLSDLKPLPMGVVMGPFKPILCFCGTNTRRHVPRRMSCKGLSAG
jgi:hypothetical protein